MKKLLLPVAGLLTMLYLNSCTIETSKKKDGFKIEITASDDLVINGEKINDKKLDKEIKKLIRELEKEGKTKAEIQKSIESGKLSVSEVIEEMKKELEEIKSQNNH